MKTFRSGYVSLVGRPNVGKSTLLNTILGEKVAIVTPKPQTTRNRINGIKTLPHAQIIFIDTPGIHKPRQRLGEAMNRIAFEALEEVDIVLFMVEPEAPRSGDLFVLERIRQVDKPVFLLINKLDTVKKKRNSPCYRGVQQTLSLQGDYSTVGIEDKRY